MKQLNTPVITRLPLRQKFFFVRFARLTALVALLSLLGWQPNATAQSDNFDDGDDIGPVEWTHVDVINTALGGGSPQNTYDASSGKYHLTAIPSPSPLTLGPARTISVPTTIYADFYVSVDVTNWDNSGVQAFGLLARGRDFGPLTTDGYMFGYASGESLLGPGVSYITIVRVQDDLTLVDVPGSGPGGDALMNVDLYPTNDYRFVFIGHGTHLEGRVYELPNVTTPIAVVSGNTAADATVLTEGQSGVVAFNFYSATGGRYEGPVDVTFDNYYASSNCPLADPLKIVDNFNDGNDTLPAPAWAHYEPLSPFGAPGTYSFPGGNTYRIQAAASPDPGNLGQGRAGSIWTQNYTDFYVSVDVVNWDDTLHQVVGLIGRASDVGLGTTKGYIWTHDRGNPLGTGGDMDMIILDGEANVGDVLTTGKDSLYMVPGKSYRFVFKGVGEQLTGEVFELPDTLNPVVSMTGTDPTYASGTAGLIAVDNSSGYDQTADATFDNFSAGLANPALSINGSSGSAVVSWPGNLACIWVLESSPVVGPAAVWTEVPTTTAAGPAAKLLFDPASGRNAYTAAAPMNSTGNTYYRLRKL